MMKDVSPKLRLDAVVKLRERDEDRARRELADAQRQAADADRALHDANALARLDERGRGSAAEWQIAEAAHWRGIVEQRQAEGAARAAGERLGRSQAHYSGVRARAEVVRRVVAGRRHEIVRQAAVAEQKTLDSLALVLHRRATRT